MDDDPLMRTKGQLLAKDPWTLISLPSNFCQRLYIIGLGWNFNMCWWYRVYIDIYVGEGKCHIYKMQKIFYFIFAYRPMDVVFCVNIFLNLRKKKFPFLFFLLCIHKHKVNLPTNPWRGGRDKKKNILGVLFYFLLSSPTHQSSYT
jgi:hypothetical protein